MKQINIKVGDIIKTVNMGFCEVVEIQTDGIVAFTNFGKQFVPCSKIVGVECDD